MKMIMGVLLVKAIISIFKKNKNVTDNKKESGNRIIHPAEFEKR